MSQQQIISILNSESQPLTRFQIHQKTTGLHTLDDTIGNITQLIRAGSVTPRDLPGKIATHYQIKSTQPAQCALDRHTENIESTQIIEPTQQTKYDDLRHRILATMYNSARPQSLKKIADRLEGSSDSIRYHLVKMLRKGLVERSKKDAAVYRYRLTDFGKGLFRSKLSAQKSGESHAD